MTSLLFDLSATQHPKGSRHGGAEYAKAVLRAILHMGAHQDIGGFVRDDWPEDPEVSLLTDQAGIKILRGSSFEDAGAIARELGYEHFFSGVPYHFHSTDFGTTDITLALHGLRSIELPSDIYEYLYRPTFSGILKWIGKSLLTEHYKRVRLAELHKLLNVQAGRINIISSSYHSSSVLYDILGRNSSVSRVTCYCPPSAVQTLETPSDADKRVIELGLDPRKYILLVSGARWEKNSYRALRDLTSLFSEHPSIFAGFKIAVSGGLPTLLPQVDASNIVGLPYVSVSDLAGLYASSYCFVYPTLNEGFGYPPLEAMAHGAPVICSSSTSTTEVCGKGASYFDPRRGSELRARVLELALNPDRRLLWQEAGRAHERAFRPLQERDLLQVAHLLLAAKEVAL